MKQAFPQEFWATSDFLAGLPEGISFQKPISKDSRRWQALKIQLHQQTVFIGPNRHGAGQIYFWAWFALQGMRSFSMADTDPSQIFLVPLPPISRSLNSCHPFGLVLQDYGYGGMWHAWLVNSNHHWFSAFSPWSLQITFPGQSLDVASYWQH